MGRGSGASHLHRRILAALFLALGVGADAARPIVFETATFRYVLAPDARNVAFVDRATGTNHLRAGEASTCGAIRTAGKRWPATSASLARGRLTLRFGESGVRAVLRTETGPEYVAFRVESVDGWEVEELTFLNIPLSLQGSPEESFGACALALNLFTRVDALPALQSELKASCEKKFGPVGAKAAIVAAPMPRMLGALQRVLSEESELPVCKVAGPWAREIPFNHGSYLFDFGSLTETNVEDWIATARNVGFTQIDHHGGGERFFRFGDLELNRQRWPQGWETWRRIVEKLHRAGIGSILHTYAFFIDKRSRYVTPVPDQRLDAFRVFTLAEPLSADATEIVVNEPTAEVSTVTGFFEPNSVVLHIGDELVTFGQASKSPPWKFTGVKRGAFGTRPAFHARGARARHLKEMFGLFVPDVSTTLFEEIAANHAAVVNHCGFDGMYLDAIDGSSILRGPEECWYWASKFVVEIQKRLKRPVGMEMSAMWHPFWQYRTRWQAWDFPRRGHKRFIDLHAAGVHGGLLLPLHLGWWSFQTFDPPQTEPTYPDVIEHLGARLIGWDAGVSLTTSVQPGALRETPLFARAADILRTCEHLRQAGVFDERAKTKLRDPTSEFVLCTNAAGQIRFRQVASHSQTVALAEPWTQRWQLTNRFAAQPARFRIEALMAAADTETNSTVVADLCWMEAQTWQRVQAEGVRFTVEAGCDGWVTLTATNAGAVPQRAAWARMERRFDPLLNIKDRPALAVEIEGDGSGALLAFRFESPHHLAYGAVADRYVTVDFTGRRRLVLVETESSRWSDYQWNDGKHLYQVYREIVNFGAIESFSVWLQNLPPGRETKVALGPIRAVPICNVEVRHPRITVAGRSVEFPVKLEAGEWLEADGPEACRAYGPKGQPLGAVTPVGEWPQLDPGLNEVRFECGPGGPVTPRVRVVTFLQGEGL